MRKKLTLLILSAILVVTLAPPALACTPNLHVDLWGDLTPPSEFKYTPDEKTQEGIKHGVDAYLKEHPLDITLPETETETETETNSSYRLWPNFSWQNGKWFNFLR